MSVAVILGSAFKEPVVGGVRLDAGTVQTGFGEVTLYRYPAAGRTAWVLFRHGVPHKYLPNQIPYRAQAAALAESGCRALLVTSSVGVLDRSLPLHEPLLLSDLLMPENRLPDGSDCTMYPQPLAGQAHLVVEEGLFSSELSGRVVALAESVDASVKGRAVFAYTPGPRTKTSAESAMWAKLGAQVNSMSLGPEVVLCNELQIPVAGLVVGHKYSVPGMQQPLDQESIQSTLDTGREVIDRVAAAFLKEAGPVPFKNRLHRI
jgi:5'-methylthioadenosine phosphorylase